MSDSRAAGVLITRPEPGAAETARRVAALGWQPVLAPALVLASIPAELPSAQALLLTSQAAARAIPASPLPVLAVGEATAAAARAQGFAQVTAAEGDAEALAALAARQLDPAGGPLLLAVGEGYGEELDTALIASGFTVLRRSVYRAAPAAALPLAAARALSKGDIGAALFFSPRSAECAMALLRQAGLAATAAGMEAFAVSPRVAALLQAAAEDAVHPLSWRAVRTAGHPDQESMLELLGRR